MPRGRFITFEGGEGAGKSTQVKRLAAWLNARAVKTIETREPGGSPAAERVRDALLDLPAEDGPWRAETECLLHYAARRQHVDDVITPNLDAGVWALSDRFADSTMAYQGYAGGLGADRVRALHQWAIGDLAPDLTLILDLPTALGLERANARRGGGPEDVYERRPTAFHEAVREGFLKIAAAEPDRCAVIDASLDLETVAAAITDAVAAKFGDLLDGA